MEVTISSDAWRANDRAPSESEICDRHGVSRITARRAVSDLVNEGLLYTVAGKGTFVADRPLRQELRPLVGFDEDLRGQGITTRAVVRDFRRIEADADLAQTLGLRQYSPVLRLSRLRLLRGQPLAVQTSYWGDEDRVPRHALTMGMVPLLGALRILLVVTGAHKHGVLRATVAGPAGPDLPASLLQGLPQAIVMADRAAWEGA